MTRDEIVANTKLMLSGGLQEPRDLIALAVWALGSAPGSARGGAARPLAGEEPRSRRRSGGRGRSARRPGRRRRRPTLGRRGRCPRARWSARCSRRRTATRAGSPTPTGSTSTARRGRTSRSRRGRTSAWARGSVGTSPGSRWRSCWTGCPNLRLDRRATRRRCAGGSSARRGPRVVRWDASWTTRSPARAETVGSLLRPPALRRRDRERSTMQAIRPCSTRSAARDRSDADRPGGRRDPRGRSAPDRLRPRRRHRRRVPPLDVHELASTTRSSGVRTGKTVTFRNDRGEDVRAARARDRRPAAAGGLAGRSRGGVHGRGDRRHAVQGDVPRGVDLHASAHHRRRARRQRVRLAGGVRR